MNIVFLSAIFVILMALIVLVTPFRRFIVDELKAIMLLAGHYLPKWLVISVKTIGVYTVVLTGVTIIALILMIIAIIIGSPGLIGFLFVTALSLILLAWLPAGVILSVFGITDSVVPKTIKTMIAWLAFVGFLGLVAPGLFSYYSIVGVALLALIIMAASTKVNLMDKLIIPLVLIMSLTLTWKEFFPDSYRSTIRYASSWAKRFDTFKDRGSILNETKAATTYGVTLKNICVLYKKNSSSSLDEAEVNIPRGTTVLISSHENEVLIIDGQSFLEIRLAKENGSFVNGQTFLVEAEYIQLATPSQIFPEDGNLLPSSKKYEEEFVRSAELLLDLGETRFDFDKGGERSPWLRFPDEDLTYIISSISKQYKIVFSDGTIYPGGQAIPKKVKPKFFIRSTGPECVIINVKK